MIIPLTPLPDTLLGPRDASYKGKVPSRFRYLAPDAANALMELLDATANGVVFTDIYRSAEASRQAYATKTGTQRPGFSAHGYGLAFDFDIGATLRGLEVGYADFLDLCSDFCFYCHRRDLAPNASESWHMNYLGPDAQQYLALADYEVHASWSNPVEQVIESRWRKDFQLAPGDITTALAKAQFASVSEFQRRWGLIADGIAGPTTQRVLAFVTADVQLFPLVQQVR